MNAPDRRTPSPSGTKDREIVLSREYDAPRELVFDAWTDPRQVVEWWGPDGFRTTIHEMDVRPGGAWRFIMHGPDGVDYPNEIIFHEVVRPARLAYSHGPVPKFEVTVLFEVNGDRTKLTLRSLFPTAEDLKRVVEQFGAIEGGKQHLARLDAFLRNAEVL
jgi:uncharacterized protein YndB with AHSA1/START domain